MNPHLKQLVMQKKAALRAEIFTKLAAKPDAKDMLNMDSFGGAYADIIGQDPLFISRIAHLDRAGRATAIAQALGQDPGFNVQHPIISSLGSTFLGSLAGSAAGAGIGLAAGPAGSPVGSLIGAGVGGIGGYLLANILRRSKMKKIMKAYEGADEGSLSPNMYDPSVLDVFGAQHNIGRAKAIAALTGELPRADEYTGTDKWRMALNSIPAQVLLNTVPGVGTGAAIGMDMFGNSEAKELLRKARARG